MNAPIPAATNKQIDDPTLLSVQWDWRRAELSSFALPDGLIQAQQGSWRLLLDGRLLHLSGWLEGYAPAGDGGAAFLAAFAREGPSLLVRSEGEFAAFIADVDSGRLWLIRDALGLRTLYWRQTEDGLAIANRPSAIAAQGANIDWLANRAVRHPDLGHDSPLAGVQRVPPGQVLEVAGADLTLHRWWRPSLTPLRLDPEEADAEGARLLRRSFDAMLADCSGETVALSLSGGLDSGLLATLAAGDPRIIALAGTVSGRSEVDGRSQYDDDAERAVEVAHGLGLPIQRCAGAPKDLVSAEAGWSVHGDRPMGSADNYAWGEAIFQAARDHGARVLLNGDLGNYTLSWPGLGALAMGGPASRLRRLRAFRRHYPASLIGGMVMSFPVLQRLHRLLRPAPDHARRNIFVRQGGERVGPPPSGPERRLALIQGADWGYWLGALRRRYGIEERDPYADRQLVEFCLRLPEEYYFGNGRLRAPARRLLGGKVPNAITQETRRGAQGSDWREAFVLSLPNIEREIDLAAAIPALAERFDLEAMREALSRYPAISWPDSDAEMTYRYDLIRCVTAMRFARDHG